MNLHLAEISKRVAPGAHAALLVDQAGRHLAGALNVPANITVVPLPAKSPELNPQENVWQFMRENWLSNRVFTSYENILDHCCHAWNTLIERPWRIISLGMREWAHGYWLMRVGISSTPEGRPAGHETGVGCGGRRRRGRLSLWCERARVLVGTEASEAPPIAPWSARSGSALFRL